MYYQRLPTKTKTSPVLIAIFLEQDRYMPECSLYAPTTPTYWENHKQVYRNITNPQDVEARKHGWCDFVVRNDRLGTFQYYKFFRRGDLMSIGMIEKWKGLSNNHQVVIFDQCGLDYVMISMDYFSQHYEKFTSKDTMEIRRLNCFLPHHIRSNTLDKHRFNNITHSKVLNIISHTELLPHEYLKYKSVGNVYTYKNLTFTSLKCLYDFIKPVDITYERFRHAYTKLGIVKNKAKEVSSYGSPSSEADASSVRRDKIEDIVTLGRSDSEAPKEQMTSCKNDDKSSELNPLEVSVDDKSDGHIEDILKYYELRAEIDIQLMNVLDMDYIEEITRKPDFYECYKHSH